MILVTGGCGFIGSALVKALVANGEQVRVLDNFWRSPTDILQEYDLHKYIINGDIRDPKTVLAAAKGCDEVIHLAYINGTKTFYSDPDLVLDVAVKGIINVIDACKACGVRKLTLASSSEVCRAKLVDADEAIPLVIPDPMNPRYSYSAGKIISEMMAIHNAKHFDRLLIFRPFNIFGKDMSEGHVIPDIRKKLKQVTSNNSTLRLLGNGNETRSFCFVDDLIDGIMLIREKGEHLGIYNIGRPEETTIAELAHKMASIMGINITIKSGTELREGDALRRRPNIEKIRALGFEPKISLDQGLRMVLNEAT